MTTKIILKVIAVMLAYSLYGLSRMLPDVFTMAVTLRHPVVIATTLITFTGWLCGIAAAVLLFLARPSARWFLTVYFGAGLIGNSAASWLPFTQVLFKQIISPYTRIGMFHAINLCILITVFILFDICKRSNNKLKPDARQARAS